MSIKAVTVEINVSKSSVLRIAKSVFEKNKRTSKVLITAPNYFVTVEYKGKRDVESIESGMVITSTQKRG